MLDILAMSASLAIAQPAAMSEANVMIPLVDQQAAAERADDADRWLLPSLIDLPEEEEGARLELRGRKIRLNVPI